MSQRSMTPSQRNCGTCAYWTGTRDVRSSIVYMDSSERATCFKKNDKTSCSELCGQWKQIGK